MKTFSFTQFEEIKEEGYPPYSRATFRVSDLDRDTYFGILCSDGGVIVLHLSTIHVDGGLSFSNAMHLLNVKVPA